MGRSEKIRLCKFEINADPKKGQRYASSFTRVHQFQHKTVIKFCYKYICQNVWMQAGNGIRSDSGKCLDRSHFSIFAFLH